MNILQLLMMLSGGGGILGNAFGGYGQNTPQYGNQYGIGGMINPYQNYGYGGGGYGGGYGMGGMMRNGGFGMQRYGYPSYQQPTMNWNRGFSAPQQSFNSYQSFNPYQNSQFQQKLALNNVTPEQYQQRQNYITTNVMPHLSRGR